MSAIWGAIDLTGKAISDTQIELLRKPFADCVLDRIEEKRSHHSYMGCGIQYVTREAQKEMLPISQEEINWYCNADVILDNRNELCQRLYKTDANENIPDGTILSDMLKNYGDNSLNTLLGAYAVVWYDSKLQVKLCVDAVGNRCVYYRVLNGVVYYSSLLKSLIPLEDSVKINARWMSDFLAMDHLFMINETEETPINGIYRVAPAQVVTITQEGCKKEIYWEPCKNTKELILDNDAEYEKVFKALFEEAVNCTLRSEDKISILLSGGLDSTSVACYAAKELRKRGRKLYSYTSVPLPEYQNKESEYYIENETEAVLKTKEFLENLECEFIEMEEENAWQGRKTLQKIIEMPYKSIQNNLWIYEAMRNAYSKGSRMMLTGSHGNTTISFSNFELYMNTMFSKGKFISIWKELNNFHALYKYSRKYALKEIGKTYFTNLKKAVTKRSYTEESFIKKDMLEKQECMVRLIEMEMGFERARKDYEQNKILRTSFLPLRQMGEIFTKYSLYSGVIERDPTKDKRIIEFCIGLPIKQFLKNGEEKRLVNKYLKSELPSHVLSKHTKGRQSADLMYRVQSKWNSIRNEWIQRYQTSMDNEYIDCEKALLDLQVHTDFSSLKEFDFVRHAYTIISLEYLEATKNLTVLLE